MILPGVPSTQGPIYGRGEPTPAKPEARSQNGDSRTFKKNGNGGDSEKPKLGPQEKPKPGPTDEEAESNSTEPAPQDDQFQEKKDDA